MILCCQVLTYVNSICIIRAKNRYQRGYDFFRPRYSYGQYGGIHYDFFITEVNALMIILANNREQPIQGCFSTG